MWTIRQLKMRGKICFQRNYWKAVLVALVILFTGGMQGSQVIRSLSMFVVNRTVRDNLNFSFGGRGQHGSGYNNNPYRSPGLYDFGNSFGDHSGDDFSFGFDSGEYPYTNNNTNPFADFAGSPTAAAVGLALIVFSLLLLVLFVILIIGILLDVFVKNPLFIGTQRFFIHNLTADGMVGDMGFGFDRSYKNQVKVMFFRDLYTFGWSLLFVIPGYIKSYEYRMIPYLMAEYPQMDKEQAFFTSRYLMHGNKWKAFVLDLSFIGWWFLSAISLGLVGVFFVNPYYVSTCTALYEALKAIRGIPEYDAGDSYRFGQAGAAYAGADAQEAGTESDVSGTNAREDETGDSASVVNVREEVAESSQEETDVPEEKAENGLVETDGREEGTGSSSAEADVQEDAGEAGIQENNGKTLDASDSIFEPEDHIEQDAVSGNVS